MMRFALSIAVVVLALTTPATSQPVAFEGFQVYERNPDRFAQNDREPTLYDVKLTGKQDALWVEGDDYDYKWLTVVPHDRIDRIVLERTRLHPFKQSTLGWVGKQVARAGDIRGWFTIRFRDRTDDERDIVLLAPVNGEVVLAEFLAERTGQDPVMKGKPLPGQEIETTAPASAPVPLEENLVQPAESSLDERADTFLLLDRMSVRDFRAAGLDKLTESELKALDAWIRNYLNEQKR